MAQTRLCSNCGRGWLPYEIEGGQIGECKLFGYATAETYAGDCQKWIPDDDKPSFVDRDSVLPTGNKKPFDFSAAKKKVIETGGIISISSIQRLCRCPYSTAQRILLELQDEGRIK